MEEYVIVNGTRYRILRLLGHGKGGYSYLAENNSGKVVVKQIHHEPCSYYTFGNKMEAELNDYRRLTAAGIRVPEMLDYDFENERIVKQYIDGPVVSELSDASAWIPQAREMAELAYNAGLNIDYYPTNFVVMDGILWYIDYECNSYMPEWSFENWGLDYWLNVPL